MSNENEISKSQRFDLGLAILSATAAPGQQHTLEQIAAFCDCRKQAILNIERRAMAKLRRGLRRENLTLADLGEES